MTLPSISNASRSAPNFRDYMPALATPNQMARNAMRLAPIAGAMIAATMIPGADGGPISWAACIAACEAVAAAATAATAGAAAPSLIACVNACWPLLPLPFCP